MEARRVKIIEKNVLKNIGLGLLMLVVVALMSSCAKTGPEAGQMKVANSAEETEPLEVGQKAASAQVYDLEDNPIELVDILAGRKTVLIFYRGGWCPYCSTHMGKLATIEDDLKKAGFQILAMAPDLPRFLKEAVKDKKYGFTILSDYKAEAAKAFGLAFRGNSLAHRSKSSV